MSPKYSSTHFCFWIVALFFLLWNLVGVLSFFTHTFISDASLAALPENERALYTQYPLWTTIVFGAAVFYGFTSALGLLMKKKMGQNRCQHFVYYCFNTNDSQCILYGLYSCLRYH